MREISAAILVVAGVIALSTCSLIQGFAFPHVTLLPLGLVLTGMGLNIWYRSISTPNNVSITVDRASTP